MQTIEYGNNEITTTNANSIFNSGNSTGMMMNLMPMTPESGNAVAGLVSPRAAGPLPGIKQTRGGLSLG